jgi:hypothetical protein
LESVTVTETVNVPAPEGVQPRVRVLEELHPVGSPDHEYVSPPDPLLVVAEKVVLWPRSTEVAEVVGVVTVGSLLIVMVTVAVGPYVFPLLSLVNAHME